MARDVVEEASALTIRVRFFDPDGAPVTPTNVYWHLKDLTNDRLLQDWTAVATGEFVDIEITPTQNSISDSCHGYQEHVLSVKANQDLDTQFCREQRYVVANLQGFTS